MALIGRFGIGLAALAMATAGCGDPEPAATPSPVTTATTAPTTTPTAPSSTGPTTTTMPSTPPTPSTPLGPEWRQQDGRVLIEAVASGDPQQLLADLVVLGLTDGVVAGRLVNGWLPVEAFDQATQLPSLQFVQPTGAGTGT